MSKKLSFILPIYKVEAYLARCVDSILSQSNESCEIILVDDGSPDGCGAICDRYAQASSLVRVIHKPNGGLASARNAGFKQAVGDYVAFVDSDDWIEPETVSKLLDWIDTEGKDICFLQLSKAWPDGRKEPMGEALSREALRGQTAEAALTFLSSRPKFPGSACGKLFRRAFLEEHDLHFPDDRRLSEDLIFCLNAYLAAQSFDWLDFPYYCYRQSRDGSITNEVTPKYYFDTSLFVTEVAQRYAPDHRSADAKGQCALSFAAYEYSILVWQMVFLKGEHRDRALKFLKDYRWVLPYGKGPKTKLVAMAVGLLGLKGAAKLLEVYMGSRG